MRLSCGSTGSAAHKPVLTMFCTRDRLPHLDEAACHNDLLTYSVPNRTVGLR
jgi:hypothetical protein